MDKRELLKKYFPDVKDFRGEDTHTGDYWWKDPGKKKYTINITCV